MVRMEFVDKIMVIRRTSTFVLEEPEETVTMVTSPRPALSLNFDQPQIPSRCKQHQAKCDDCIKETYIVTRDLWTSL